MTLKHELWWIIWQNDTRISTNIRIRIESLFDNFIQLAEKHAFFSNLCTKDNTDSANSTIEEEKAEEKWWDSKERLGLRSTQLAPQSVWKESLCRFLSLDSFLRYHLPALGLKYSSSSSIIDIIDKLSSIDLEDTRLSGRMRGYRPIVWTTVNPQEVEDLDGFEVACRLGQSDLCKSSAIVRIPYKLNELVNDEWWIRRVDVEKEAVRVPCTLDTMGNTEFFPSNPNDPYGFTRDLRNDRVQWPEIVHLPANVNRLTIKDIKFHINAYGNRLPPTGYSTRRMERWNEISRNRSRFSGN